ncbi:WecB/TagA/CpsF family glycosyltransferase [Kocuria sp. WN036]|uniref:WecB/TagA/CpsF family glycosyltransferase n=1 Tax=Kocuria sp. WN036 TaxID=2032628 RepID=UPI0015950220|nr:WecB/TagA/CpsF family glycosyltransferase [Kocuria sp. WN036]
MAASLRGAATNYPDGKPLYWIGRFMRRDRNFSQVRGPGLFQEVIFRSTPEIRHFFLGATPEVLSELERAVKRLNPQINIVGLDSPPYSAADRFEWNRRNEAINASDANLVWVGLGTPKQDLEAQRLTEETMITTVAVGAAFDFLAGNTKEAPVWMQKAGFEWLFRLLSEPRRLWRRYLLGNIKFIILTFRRG